MRGVGLDPRAPAARELASTLRRSRVHGVTTNRDLLVATLLHPEVLAGTADTGFYDAHGPAELTAGSGLSPELGAVAAALADAAAGRPSLGGLAGMTPGFRNVGGGLFRRRGYAVGEAEISVGYRVGRDGLEVESLPEGVESLALVSQDADRVVLLVDGVRRTFEVSRHPVAGQDEPGVAIDSALGSVELRTLPRFVDPSAQAPEGALVAPMPGAVVRVAVEVGDTVTAGQPLMWLEAMKMEHPVAAPAAGTVTEVMVTVGQQVEQGTSLAVVESTEEDAA